MSIAVADCPRCGAEHMTFDVVADLYVRSEYGWKRYFEICSICRRCHRTSILVGGQKEPHDDDEQFFSTPHALTKYNGSVNDYVKIEGYISLKDEAAQPPPEHLPDDIRSAFAEGATCVAVKCWNAAAAMFRLCIDLATRPLLPED